jgi:hypothetical protein
MHDLHHSDILTYALSHMASEYARDKPGTVKGLQKCIEDTNSRHGLGASFYEDLNEAGPGYAIRAPGSDAGDENTDAAPR